jgi:predicted secreted protein
MGPIKGINACLKCFIAVILLGFILSFSGVGGVRGVGAKGAGPQTFIGGFSWEYQLDFNAASLPGAKQLAASLDPGLKGQGVASRVEPVGNGMYRLSLTGSQSMQQLRQVVFSSALATFIGGAAEVEVSMPVGSLLDTAFKLESNPSTGFAWDLLPSTGIAFTQTAEPEFTIRSRGYGVPAVETLGLHPEFIGNGIIKLLYHRSFEPDQAITRHLRITLGAQALEIDLSDPNPAILAIPAEVTPAADSRNPIAEIPLKGALPGSFDWRTAGIVPAVRNQSSCGSCWSFGTVGIMESAIAKAGGPMTDLSEQFLISCNTGSMSCSGGLTAHKWHYDTLGKNQTAIGAVLETDKPYTASNGSCTSAYNHPYKLSGWQFIVATEFTMPTVDQIKNAIYTYGPVTAGVCADSGWDGYSGGVYNPTSNGCSGSTNHQIILVGWDDATSTWILRNSWGPSWGESGYMRIKWDTTGTKSRVGEGTSWVTWGGAQPAPFSKTSPVNGTFENPSNPNLSWETSASATSYEYCIDTSDNSSCDTSWVSTTGNSVSLSGLANGGYSWQARARNASGTTDTNAGAWWNFAVGPARKAFLPIGLRNFSGTAASLINGDFESGTTGWTVSSTHLSPIIGTTVPDGTAHTGAYAAWLGGNNDEIGYIQQQVSISVGASYLVYWQWINSLDSCGWDFARVLVNGSEVDSYTLCYSSNTGGWVQHSVNLSAYAGQSITLQIRAETDGSYISNLSIDDISFQASAPASAKISPAIPDLDVSTISGKSGILLP